MKVSANTPIKLKYKLSTRTRFLFLEMFGGYVFGSFRDTTSIIVRR